MKLFPFFRIAPNLSYFLALLCISFSANAGTKKLNHNNLTTLPDDLLINMMENIPSNELPLLAGSSKKLHDLIHSKRLFERTIKNRPICEHIELPSHFLFSLETTQNPEQLLLCLFHRRTKSNQALQKLNISRTIGQLNQTHILPQLISSFYKMTSRMDEFNFENKPHQIVALDEAITVANLMTVTQILAIGGYYTGSFLNKIETIKKKNFNYSFPNEFLIKSQFEIYIKLLSEILGFKDYSALKPFTKKLSLLEKIVNVTKNLENLIQTSSLELHWYDWAINLIEHNEMTPIGFNSRSIHFAKNQLLESSPNVKTSIPGLMKEIKLLWEEKNVFFHSRSDYEENHFDLRFYLDNILESFSREPTDTLNFFHKYSIPYSAMIAAVIFNRMAAIGIYAIPEVYSPFE